MIERVIEEYFRKIKLILKIYYIEDKQKNITTDMLDFIKILMADRTGLEPATPGVTGRYSNQLNYRSASNFNI